MTGSSNHQDRRSEPRRPAVDRISWIRDTATRAHSGWMSDVAATGIAFVTPTRDLPAPGEAIDLKVGCGGVSPDYRRVRVVRAAPYDRFFSTIGCRDETPAASAPSISPAAARRP